jgi:transcription initiation factor IIF auxiliary subunit
MAEVTAEEVANWMLEQVRNKGILHQAEAVQYIREHFGESFIYVNENGNESIDKEVKKVFRKLHRGKAAWEREGFFWGWS